MTRKISTAAVFFCLAMSALAQKAAPAAPRLAAKPPAKAVPQLSPQQKFVLDTVTMAVALPQSDPQDRLRVLSSAADVVSVVDQKMARGLWKEGVRIESELIRAGQAPAVSVMSGGQADCNSARDFVDSLGEDAVVAAEQSLIGALTSCPKQTLDSVSSKLDAALDKRMVAPRALMAAMQAQGENSRWSQTHFEKMFSSLPDSKQAQAESENFAAMYAQMGPSVDKDLARKTGLQLLDWLSKVDEAGLRNSGINITAGAMKEILGDEGFKDAMAADVVAGSAVQNVGTETPERPSTDTVSVLGAMGENGTDVSSRLQGLPAVDRAKEAAAHGFAAGTSGHPQQATTYFDMAFAALDEVWGSRSPDVNSAGVVEEVCEAAAQVNSLNALARAQKLQDPSAQAIGMLAVARIVAGNGIAQ